MSVTTIVMIGCSASKRDDAPAGLASHFYTGELFKLQSKWAMNAGYGLGCYILSAKYGVLSFGNAISTYEATLDTAQKRRAWNELVIGMIRENRAYLGNSLHLPSLTEPCRVIVMAGENYRGWIAQMQEIAPLWTFEVPLAGLGIGQQKAALGRMNQQLEEDKRAWPQPTGSERWNRSLAKIKDDDDPRHCFKCGEVPEGLGLPEGWHEHHAPSIVCPKCYNPDTMTCTEPCPYCEGTGLYPDQAEQLACDICLGGGKVSKAELTDLMPMLFQQIAPQEPLEPETWRRADGQTGFVL